jgi:hypothetical protein
MGYRQYHLLMARGWWKGNWRTTLRHQKRQEFMALMVALNVVLIGLVCLAVVTMKRG